MGLKLFWILLVNRLVTVQIEGISIDNVLDKISFVVQSIISAITMWWYGRNGWSSLYGQGYWAGESYVWVLRALPLQKPTLKDDP
jgi:hypothetical protein